MTLVQNRPLQLNGSKLVVLLFLMALLSSCDAFKKIQGDDDVTKTGEELDEIQGKKVYDSKTGTYIIVEEAPTEIMDTIKWKDLPSTSNPPITSEGAFVESAQGKELIEVGEFGSEFYTSYNISLILPFLTDRVEQTDRGLKIDSRSYWAINYYGGVRLALDEFKQEGISLNLSVVDSKASTSAVRGMLGSDDGLREADLIIGPYRKNNVQIMAEYAKRKSVTFVSPYSAASEISQRNPDYIQVNPTLKTHCAAITRHVRDRYRTDQVILVSRDNPSETARFKYFHDENFVYSLGDTTRFREYIISENSVDLDRVNVLPLMQLQDTTVFIIPSWSEETFIISFLRKLDLAQTEDQHIIVYGMPQWMKYERVDYNHFENLHVHVSSGSYVDPFSTDAQFFRRRYFEEYGEAPKEEAYLGYDVMRYFGKMLHKYGTKFQYWIDQEQQQQLHTRFEFDRVVKPSTTGAENLPIEQFENKYVNILRFQDYQFQLAE